MSPAQSMEQSVDSLSSSRDDAPPPLPMKTRTVSNISSQSGLGSHNNSSESLNSLKTSTEENKESAAASTPEINMFSNKLFTEDSMEKSKSLPLSARGLGSLEPLKPPPSEKRTSATLRPSSGVNKALSGGTASVPRPKPGQVNDWF